MTLDRQYWENRYLTNDTPWDIGQVSPPLKAYLDTLTDKDIRILVPGAGRGHEAIYLHCLGFNQVYVCDWAPSVLKSISVKVPDFPASHLLSEDFFTLEGTFDLIIEHTFFCALLPEQRPAYVQKCQQLLTKDGMLAGLLFASEFLRPGPPFGAQPWEYRALFEPFFEILTLELSQTSIQPRTNNELFILMKNSK